MGTREWLLLVHAVSRAGAQDAPLLPSACLAEPGGSADANKAAPRIQVVDFFHDLFMQGGCSAPRANVSRLPWLPPNWPPDLVPSLRSVDRAQLFGTGTVYAQGVCAPNGGLPRAPSAGCRGLCVHATSRVDVGRARSSRRATYEQYDSERLIMARWLRSTDVCDHATSIVAPRTRGATALPHGPPCDADILILPSMWLHDFAIHGRSWSAVNYLSPCAGVYWRTVRAFFERSLARTPPIVVIVETWPPNVAPQEHSLAAIAHSLPPSLAARLVIGTTMSNVRVGVRALMHRADAHWREGAEEELARREAVAARLRGAEEGGGALRGGHGRVHEMVRLVRAPLLVSLPYTVGVSRTVDWSTACAPCSAAARAESAHASAGAASALRGPPLDSACAPPRRPLAVLYSATMGRRGSPVSKRNAPRVYPQRLRPQLVSALLRAGAECSRKGDRCTLRARGAVSELTVLTNMPDGYALTTRATFCVEPPGDSLDRSHVYVAILSGCIPVLWNGGHADYAIGEPAWWPWRAARQERLSPWPTCAPHLDYSTFALFFDAQVANSTSWVHELLAIESDGARLHALRTGLRRAARAFTYARAECGSDDCDAFSLFRGVVARAWRSRRALTLLPRRAS